MPRMLKDACFRCKLDDLAEIHDGHPVGDRSVRA
jgi:hypothetical protein